MKNLDSETQPISFLDFKVIAYTKMEHKNFVGK